ncbi:MAG: two-component regulator propeller domain-containing protein [Crocinitomicaceae bacterium]
MKQLLSCLLLVLPFFGMSQKYAFQSYSTEEGLPQTQVTSFCQDDNGYLWVGTLGGLAKFNGQDFITYFPKDGLLSNRIQTLLFEGGKLWVGHDGGISYWDKTSFKNIELPQSEKSRSVKEIVRFKGEILVCAERGGGLFKLVKDKLKPVFLPVVEGQDERKVKSIRSACIVDDELYLATEVGVLKTKDLKNFVYEEELEGSFYGIESDLKDIYFISGGNGIYRKEVSSGRITQFINKDAQNSFYIGSELDSRGALWVYSKKNVFKISQDNTFGKINLVSGLPEKNGVECIYNDRSGNVWIGSSGKGMFRFPGDQFKCYDRSNGCVSDLFLSGFETKEGSFYFGSYDEGVVKLSPEGSIKQIEVSSPVVWAAQYNVDGLNWFGTSDGLVSLDANDNVTFYDDDGVPGYKISAFYKIGPSEMYVGGSSGIALYKDGFIKRLDSENSIGIGTVRQFVELDNLLLFATNLGLFQYKDGKISSYLNVDKVTYCITKDRDRNLWFGTEEGLFRIKNSKVEQIELRNDPGANFINFIDERNGRLFVGSNNGLFILDNLESAEPSIKRFGLGEGVINLETNLNSSFFDSKGNYWFGTAAGLVCFDVQLEDIKRESPQLKMRSILLNYEPFDHKKYSDELDESGFPINLILPSSKNNLTFELDGVSLANHSGLGYQFLLEGENETWSPLSTNPTFNFTSLSSGDYVLHMRAVDIDGQMSGEILMPFTIKPPFYKTWWFIGLMILTIGILVLLIFRFRLRRINEANEKEKLEFKSRLLSLEQQSMNASMNRHFVFNSLNSIQYFINTQDRLSANKYLTNFAKLIRKNLDTATIDGNMITLDEELERIELYLSLESMRFKDRFDYEINTKGVELDALEIPAMILQPFVENSIIHGILPNLEKKGKIMINVEQENGYLLISLEDNGIGVNQSMTSKVEMDGDHRSKGMEITSKRIDLIQKISKNDISLIGPYEVYKDDRSIKGTRVLLKIPLNNLEI